MLRTTCCVVHTVECQLIRYEGGQGSNEDDMEYTSYDIGEECLDRLAIALGGKTVLPIAFSGPGPRTAASKMLSCTMGTLSALP